MGTQFAPLGNCKFGKNFRLTVAIDPSALEGPGTKLLAHISLQIYAVDTQGKLKAVAQAKFLENCRQMRLDRSFSN